jgi:hypothetical protein
LVLWLRSGLVFLSECIIAKALIET